ncbi:hypothetical protein [Bradyrhizobium sp. th.b2]|uniref:hypothetical protein n=1 Tax=Bradyrhizobium sp. th-b2 TaxID=172088 RepID=UPI000569FD56|nr:hypothetical protein [Bradyrhizobium sp. th.b2]
MTLIEASIRDQINRDLDCSEASCRLMAMRAEVAELIGRWKASGGGDRLPTVRERLSRSFADRPVATSQADPRQLEEGHAQAGPQQREGLIDLPELEGAPQTGLSPNLVSRREPEPRMGIFLW